MWRMSSTGLGRDSEDAARWNGARTREAMLVNPIRDRQEHYQRTPRLPNDKKYTVTHTGGDGELRKTVVILARKQG